LAAIVSLLDRHEFDRGGCCCSRTGGIATGVLTYLWPSVTAQALVYLIAAWAILTSAFEVVAAVDLRKLSRRAAVGLGQPDRARDDRSVLK